MGADVAVRHVDAGVVLEHDAFRLTGRSRSEQNSGEAGNRSRTARSTAGARNCAVVQFFRPDDYGGSTLRVSSQCGEQFGGRFKPIERDHSAHSRLRGHVGQTPRRQVGAHRDIGASGLEDRQKSQRQMCGAEREHACGLFRIDPAGDESVSNGIGSPVKFDIRDNAAVGNDGRGFRLAMRQDLETFVHAESRPNIGSGGLVWKGDRIHRQQLSSDGGVAAGTGALA